VASPRSRGGALTRSALALAVCVALGSCSRVGTQSANLLQRGSTIPGVVRIAEAEEPNSLLRIFSNQSSADDVTALLFEPFFRFDERERVVPALATTFPTLQNGLISKDGLRVTFPLRASARWSDGQPVTSQDVIFTWRAIVNGRNPVVSTWGYDKIKTIVADGPHRVTLVMKQPFAPAVYLFSEGSFPPLPAHLLARYASIYNIGYDAAPVGDGPFVLHQWLHGSDIIFDANPLYWRGPPPVREIDVKIVPDPVTQLNLLRTHEIDVVDGVAPNLARELPAVSHIWVKTQLQSNYRHLDFNCAKPVLRDVNVRRAIALAIDVPKIINDVYGGYAVRAATDIPPYSWAANTLQPIPYDPARAAQILSRDGWVPGADGIRHKGGQALALSISTATNNRTGEDSEALIAADLAKIGIKLAIKNYAGTLLFAENGPLYGGTYDMEWSLYFVGTDPDDLALWGCRYFPPHGSNTSFYCNPKVDKYLEDAEVSYDQARRKADYEAAWRILIQDVPADIIYWSKVVVAGNADLRGFKPSPVITDYWNAYQWRI
jgi:peptide/nickel transport system substrate-binding protein